MIKQIANERPQNLIKYSESMNFEDTPDGSGAKSIEMQTFGVDNQFKSSQSMELSVTDSYDSSEDMSLYRSTTPFDGKMSFCQYLSDIFWKLYSIRPKNPLIATIARGLTQIALNLLI